MCYIENAPYKYPSIDVDTIVQGTHYDDLLIDTGWHVIPNFLWRHCCIPRQWNSLVTECEAYKIKAVDLTIYNPIPITTNISLQRTSLFSAFNNCTYALTYTDDKYETDWYPWSSLKEGNQLHLSQREGILWQGTQTGQSSNYTSKRYQWPIYNWRRPNMRTCIENMWSQGKTGQAGVHDVYAGDVVTGKLATPAGVFWDPFNCPEEIGELRAGKNSISFSWNTHPCDEDKWFNLDAMAAFTMWTTDGPYCGVGRPGTWRDTTAMDPNLASTYGLAQQKEAAGNGTSATDYADYTIPNMANMPLVPTKWFWKEVQNSVIDWYGDPGTFNTSTPMWLKSNKYWSGTEWEAAAYPPCQWFTKGIPLYDVSDQHIRTSTQVSVQIKLTLEGKKRRSAYFCPTYGPISGQQLYYQKNERLIFQPGCIRYRTGGKRRTWQNMQAALKTNAANSTQNQNQNVANVRAHPRIDPYLYKMDTDPLQVDEQLRYNQKHRIAGMPDQSGANRATAQLKESHPLIRVTWNRATDSTEIIMEEPENEEREEESSV